MRLSESAVDTSKVWFHGSSEARVTQLDPPSYEHPFYVTSDLHYAMAFCTKNQSSTGDYEVEKTFTPADWNYVYVVTLKSTCQVFDFRDKTSPEFKKLYSIVDKEIVDWVLDSADDLDFDDIYEFIIGLDQELLSKIENYSTYQQYYEASHYTSGKQLETIGKAIPQSVFEKAKTFALRNGIQKVSELDIHEIMAPILKKLNKLGFQGILTKEHDYNDEVSQIHTTPAKVTTDYAIGIFDKSGLDIIGLVPMRYKWLKKINPDYWYNSTSETASQKIKRFIQLYKQITKQKTSVSESSLDTAHTWYFGNNRSKNLRIAKPSWNAPFFLTTSYEYAEEYSDYGVYKIELENEKDLNILDFSSKSEVRKLGWPDVLLRKIQTGENDLNSIAYDMYILAFGTGGQLMYIQDNAAWRKAALYFKQKSKGIFSLIRRGASAWGSEPDHAFVLQMWKDIYDAGFAGFTQTEFTHKVLALFNFHCIDKISVKPVEKEIGESYEPPYALDQIKQRYPRHVYDKLSRCPIHRWRAETGIELIHKEPTEEELERIWKNWQLMPQEMKDISDRKSLELFGCTNAKHYAKLKNEQVNEEEDIANNDAYLSGMAKSFADKAWFLKYIPNDVTTIVDFGGGTGDFAKFCQSKRPDLQYVIIDNNTEFFDQAKSNGFIAASSLQNLIASKAIDFSKTLLVLSSVIHEVYSYADANAFWKDIQKCGFRAIAIRDMSYDENAMRSAPIDAICWVYENVFMSETMTYKGKPFKEITESFEDVWGKICDPETKRVNGKNLFHFLIKYRYQENWAREVEENYLPVSKEKLASTLASIGYAFTHKESSKLAFYDKCWKKDFKLGLPDNNGYRKQFYAWLTTLATHIKWMLEKKNAIGKLNENKSAYFQKYASEDDVGTVVEMFWHIKNKLSAPQNDIDWWIKKPFNDLKSFVQNFDTSNKRQRRDANYKRQAIEDGAKLLDTKDGYEIWYVPTYDAMVTLGRFYKGRSAKWCVASDDPDFWFDNHEDSEFVVLVREHPKNDEFDKVAIEMMNHGRYYNEDDIIPWDLENEDYTFDKGVIDNSEELVHYAWQLFKDNGETRNMFVG